MTERPPSRSTPRERTVRPPTSCDIYKQTDRLFAGLMGFQWIAGIVFALWVSPLAWSGSVSRTHIHVWAAIVVGGIISLFPALLGLFRPGRPSTRYTIAAAQMLMGALLIHLTGGRLETHFHVFGSLAFLAFYRDWRVLVPATIVVALDHMLRGAFWPQSVYGVLVASQWRWVEHAAWVAFEDVFLVVSCLRSVREMRETAERTATLEQEVRTRQQAETDARNAWARNDGILDVALDCVILVDESGRIVQFNPGGGADVRLHRRGGGGHRAGRADCARRPARSAPRELRAVPHERADGGAEPAPRAVGGPQGRRDLSGRGRDRADFLRRHGDVRRLHARHHRTPARRSRAGRADVARVADGGGRPGAHARRRFARHAAAVRRGADSASRRRPGAHLDAQRDTSRCSSSRPAPACIPASTARAAACPSDASRSARSRRSVIAASTMPPTSIRRSAIRTGSGVKGWSRSPATRCCSTAS